MQIPIGKILKYVGIVMIGMVVMRLTQIGELGLEIWAKNLGPKQLTMSDSAYFMHQMVSKLHGSLFTIVGMVVLGIILIIAGCDINRYLRRREANKEDNTD